LHSGASVPAHTEVSGPMQSLLVTEHMEEDSAALTQVVAIIHGSMKLPVESVEQQPKRLLYAYVGYAQAIGERHTSGMLFAVTMAQVSALPLSRWKSSRRCEYLKGAGVGFGGKPRGPRAMKAVRAGPSKPMKA